MKLSDLYVSNPYDNFDTNEYPMHIVGWNSYAPIFEQIIDELRPHTYIEVGVYLGASIIHVAELCKKKGIECACIANDTFLGSLEMIRAHLDPERDLMLKHGFPQIYFQFISNVIQSQNADRIIPFPQTSLIAADWFAKKGITAPFIYIDAAHEYQHVLADIRAYWPLLEPGGILLGDDYDSFSDVAKAVRQFCQENNLRHTVPDGRKWVIRK